MLIPSVLYSGAVQSFTVALPSGASAAVLMLKKAGAAAVPPIVSDAAGIFTLSPLSLSLYAPGSYCFQLFAVTAGTYSLLENGTVELQPVFSAAPEGYDPRQWETVLIEAIKAQMSGNATRTQESLKVGDKELKFLSRDELQRQLDYLEWRVWRDTPNSGANGGIVKIQFAKV